MSHAVTLGHHFEAAHRLPHLGGKCRNLHGHTWQVQVTVTSDSLDEAGTVVEFGSFKRRFRDWIDEWLDHGTMLGGGDPLKPALSADGTKLFLFGDEWPTVENVAAMLAVVASEILASLPAAPGARITRVLVRETSSNAAEWAP